MTWGRQVGSNPSNCKKYNENFKFLGSLFFSYIIHNKILFVFLQWISESIKLIFGIIYLKKYCLCICQFWQYLENITYDIFCADIAKLLQYFNNISDRFRNILAFLQYFQVIFLQYFLNISVLCGYLFSVAITSNRFTRIKQFIVHSSFLITAKPSFHEYCVLVVTLIVGRDLPTIFCVWNCRNRSTFYRQ